MTIGVLQASLEIPGNRSLKGKRRVLNSLKARLRNKFNVSVAEIDTHDYWQRATIGVCCISSQSRHANEMINEAARFIECFHETVLLDIHVEML
ncbi:DUF503 domain-containing protein [Candidatus Hydrogenedentota bacterium]